MLCLKLEDNIEEICNNPKIIKMKILAIIGLIISIIGISSGIYCQIEYMPKVDQADIFGPELWHSYMEDKFMLGSIALFSGIAGVLVGTIAGIKKEKIGWIAVLIGLVSFFLGALQSTHMFS
jgi:disulfide bond formation protein DsbB